MSVVGDEVICPECGASLAIHCDVDSAAILREALERIADDMTASSTVKRIARDALLRAGRGEDHIPDATKMVEPTDKDSLPVPAPKPGAIVTASEATLDDEAQRREPAPKQEVPQTQTLTSKEISEGPWRSGYMRVDEGWLEVGKPKVTVAPKPDLVLVPPNEVDVALEMADGTRGPAGEDDDWGWALALLGREVKRLRALIGYGLAKPAGKGEVPQTQTVTSKELMKGPYKPATEPEVRSCKTCKRWLVTCGCLLSKPDEARCLRDGRLYWTPAASGEGT